MSETKSFTLHALTTFDNPFNPIDDYDKWLAYDIAHGYNTSNYLANVAKTSELLSEEENENEIEFAIDEIVKVDPTFYKKVTKETKRN